MSIITSILIPLSSNIGPSDLIKYFDSRQLFMPCRDISRIRQRRIKHFLFFTKVLNETIVYKEGLSNNDRVLIIKDVLSGERSDGSLGVINNDVKLEIMKMASSNFDIGDWEVSEILIDHIKEVSWGDSNETLSDICLIVRGYGNPIGTGCDFIHALAKSSTILDLIRVFGKKAKGAKSDCISYVDGNLIFADMDC